MMGSPLRLFYGNTTGDMHDDIDGRRSVATPPGSPLRRFFFSNSTNNNDAGGLTPPASPLRRIFPFPKKDLYHHQTRNSHPATGPPRSFSITLMEENLELAEPVIISSSGKPAAGTAAAKCLFLTDPLAARDLLRAVSEVREALVFFASDDTADEDRAACSRNLARAQRLMDTAMRVLQLEFRHLLAAYATAEEGDAPTEPPPSSSPSPLYCLAIVADLRDVCEAMITSGYGKECVKAYKSIRKPHVAAELDRLELERLTPSNVNKLNWTSLEPRIRTWLSSFPAAVTSVFSGERDLCRRIFNFDTGTTAADACFAEAAGDAALSVVSFPESVAKSRRSPEKLFRLLDLYDAVSSRYDEINTVFSGAATADVRSQALSSLLKLAEAARGTIGELEVAIQRDSSRETSPAGAVHPIARYVLNYAVFLSDYEPTLDEIFADFPLQELHGHGGQAAARLARIVEILMKKIDGKAEIYRDASISDLFLVNNLGYAAAKVKQSRLSEILGDEFVGKMEERARVQATGHERRKWVRVASSIPAAVSSEKEAEDGVAAFGAALDEACRSCGGSSSTELQSSVTRAILPAYRRFYWRCRGLLGSGSASRAVLMSPEEVRNRLVEAFSSLPSNGGGSSSSSIPPVYGAAGAPPVSRAVSFGHDVIAWTRSIWTGSSNK